MAKKIKKVDPTPRNVDGTAKPVFKGDEMIANNTLAPDRWTWEAKKLLVGKYVEMWYSDSDVPHYGILRLDNYGHISLLDLQTYDILTVDSPEQIVWWSEWKIDRIGNGKTWKSVSKKKKK